MSNTPLSTTELSDFIPYLNYVAADTSTLVDYEQPWGSLDCGDTVNHDCLRLHNGAMLVLFKGVNFCGTTRLNSIYFLVDADGAYNGSNVGPGKSVVFYLYYDGRITSSENILPGTITQEGGCSAITPGTDPEWFSWS